MFDAETIVAISGLISAIAALIKSISTWRISREDAWSGE